MITELVIARDVNKIYINISYEQEFDDLWMYLKSKYSQKLFDIDGIGKQLDLAQFSKTFFSKNISTAADASIDANANVDDISVISYSNELKKPFERINSYYMLWKEAKRLYGLQFANEIIEMQITGDIYIHDFNGVGAGVPYSYYEKTSIVINDNGEIIYSTMKELFDIFCKKYKAEVLPDREVIYLKNVKVLDKDNKWVDLKCILRHKSHTNLVKIETKNGFSTIVTTDHPVILEDGSEKYAKDLSLEDKIMISNSEIPLLETKDVDEDYAYLIGFMIGDGWINKTEGVNVEIRRGSISICQNNIEDTKIYRVANKLYNNVALITENRINFGYKKDVEDLLDTGIKSINRKLPNNILQWDKKAIKALLAGIIDSDGNINKQNGIITIRVISFELAQQVGELLRALNIGNVRVSFAGVYKSMNGYKSNNDVFRVSIRLTDREFIEFSESIKNKQELVFKKMKSKDGRFETNEIHKLENWITPEYVYDITTSTGHFHCQGLIQHNCYNYSAYDIMVNGLSTVKKIISIPPKYLYSFKSQLEQFVTIASNSTLGATGIADLLIILAFYAEDILKTKSDAHFRFQSEEDCWRYIEENIVSFIYTINQPMRGNQSPFTNISVFDRNFLEKLCDDYTHPITFGNPKIEIVEKLQELFLDIMNKELSRTPVTFPITTACFSIDEDNNILDKDFLKMIAEKNRDYGFINIYCGKTSTLSSCCRLRSEQDNEYFNSFGSGSSKIGSLGVVSINFPRLAIKNKDNQESFFEGVTTLVDICAKINNIKRHIVKKRIANGNHPLYTNGFIDLNTQYSTVGVNGFNEAIEIMGYDILTEEGTSFGIDIINTINRANTKNQNQYKAPHNCEQVPGENMSIKMSEKDKLFGYNNGYNIYSNQFIPLTTNADLLDRIEIQGKFDKHFSGGSICHLNIEQKIEDSKLLEELIEVSAKMGVIYFAINYNIQRCTNGHMTVGKKSVCDICGAEITDNFTRVVGFLVNTKNWHKVRREEDYPNRKWYMGID